MFLALLKVLATNFICFHEKRNMKTECPVTSKSLGHIKQVFSNQISKQAPGLNELLG